VEYQNTHPFFIGSCKYSSVGIDDNFNSKMVINLYPNPTKNQLNIILTSNQNTKLEIFSIEGKLVEQQTIQKNTVVDVSKYNTGLYFIQATTNDGKIYRNKFVKE
jgi:hypothetical protein